MYQRPVLLTAIRVRVVRDCPYLNLRICAHGYLYFYILHGMELLSFNMLGLAMKLTLRASRGSVTLIGYIYTDAALVLDTC